MTAEPGSWWLVLLGGLARQAARVAEADRGRAALLAAVSHDLRTPLAAAKTAVSGLRAGDDWRRMVLDFRTSPAILNYVNGAEVGRYATQGVVTPDHTIRTKNYPLIVGPAAGVTTSW